MNLKDICYEIADISAGLAYGEISFVYDNLMSALKPGHPADVLVSILEPIANDVLLDKEVDNKRIEKVLSNLKDFKECFKVKELSTPIKHLKEFIKNKTCNNSNNKEEL